MEITGRILEYSSSMSAEFMLSSRASMRLALPNPYGEWLNLNLVHLQDLPAPDRKPRMHTQEQRDKLYKVFGYTQEDMQDQILPMARTGSEPTASMGTDVPLAGRHGRTGDTAGQWRPSAACPDKIAGKWSPHWRKWRPIWRIITIMPLIPWGSGWTHPWILSAFTSSGAEMARRIISMIRRME